MPRMRKNFIPWNFSWRIVGWDETWDATCFKKCLLEKQQCSKHLHHIAIEKDILSELNRCIFQISLKYIKLVIPKILFILVLCIFNFYFKITWPHSPPNKIKISVSAIKERLKKVTSVPNECVRLGLLLNKNKKSQKCGFQFEEINWLNVPDQCIWLLWGKILSCWTYLFFTQL